MKSSSLAGFAVLALLAASSRAGEPDTTWYVILTESGTPIGHASHEIVQHPDGREIIDSQELNLAEEGPPTTLTPWSGALKGDEISGRTVRKEDRDGNTLSVETESRTGRDLSRNTARIAGDTAEITRETAAETRKIVVPLPRAVRFDNGEALLKTWDPAATPRLEFDDFNIDAMAVDRVTIEAVPARTSDPRGTIAALRKRYQGTTLLAVSRLLLDGDRRVVESVQPIPGASIAVRIADRDTALKPNSPYRVLANVMTKSPFLISMSAMQGHIRYRFTFRDGIDFALPATGEQRETADQHGVTLDVCADCGAGLPSDPAALADALKPTAWLQSDAAAIKAIADPVAKLAVSDARKMELLLAKAKPELGRVDFTGHYSALETLSRHAGDCTEAAVLLAALGRAAGIPTRVADGLVYSRESYHGVANTWMPHSWTLAWVDGKWRSFDLALDKFDSTHIALVVDDGDERSLAAASQLSGLLRWDGMAEVRSRPSE